MKMTIQELAEWREKFRQVDGTVQMKRVAADFRDTFELELRGHQIYELLRGEGNFFHLLKEVVK